MAVLDSVKRWFSPSHGATGSAGKVAGLLLPGWLDAFVAERRAREIRGRTILLAGLFCLGTLVFILPDLWWLAPALGQAMLPARLVAAAACLAIVGLAYRQRGRAGAASPLALLVFVAVAFYAYAATVFAVVPVGSAEPATGLMSGYLFLPFLIVALPSLFPLTLAEVVAIGAPAVAIQAGVESLHGLLGRNAAWAQLWLLGLLLGVAALSAGLQLSYLRASLRAAATDSLTGALTRGAGLAMLDKLIAASRRDGTPLTLLYLDIDDFKTVNDRFGHAAGDAVLRRAAAALAGELRASDLAIRLGGEEFAVALRNLREADTGGFLDRLRAEGLGTRPDGAAVTASIGLVECGGDACLSAEAAIALADERMYAAKQAGRNTLVGPGGRSAFLPAPAAGA